MRLPTAARPARRCGMRRAAILLACISLLATHAPASTGHEDLLLHVPSPDWRDQVIYMVLLDRFADGDPSNNDQGMGEFQPGSPSHFNGGDLAGLRSRIDYLKELGATAVWITPPVLNQWWSSPYAAAGWHGYWALNFKEVDPHFGTLEEYQRLSHELHQAGMFLIQDIVANHTANLFTYEGDYDPADTLKGFRLLEEDHPARSRPTQPPFDLMDRRDPAQAAAAIYNWTPSIRDHADREQELTWSLGLLADLNTRNPVVLGALKDSYRYWIGQVGVDGYRIDTVKYVDPPFWKSLLRDSDGLHPFAAGLGKEQFLTFGEVFESSRPFSREGERKIIGYLGTADEPMLTTMLGFPLYFDIQAVLAEGAPPARLAYRLKAMMESYPDPFIVPNFIDNHDTQRFLAAGSPAAFRQALALLFCIPGIPTLLQGTEQALQETRQAMFAGGFHAEGNAFDPESGTYRFVRSLARLRAAEPALRRGGLRIRAAQESTPGLLAFGRIHDQEEELLFLANTANHPILVHQLATSAAGAIQPDLLMAEGLDALPMLDEAGRLTTELPARAWLVARLPARAVEATPAAQAQSPRPAPGDGNPRITIDALPAGQPYSEDFRLTGTALPGTGELTLLLDGNLDNRTRVTPDPDGRWGVRIPVRNLGVYSHQLQVYHESSRTLTPPIPFVASVARPRWSTTIPDPAGDATGPNGRYLPPQQPASSGQRDLLGATAEVAGQNLRLHLRLAEITRSWSPPNGFDNVAFSIFIGGPGSGGQRALPLLQADFPHPDRWHLGHVAFGWGNAVFSATGSSATRRGDRLGLAPRLQSHPAEGTVTILYEGAALGIGDWSGHRLFITTWDVNGEGTYMDIAPEPSQWHFGGAPADSPKIADSLFVEIPTIPQDPLSPSY